MMNVFEFIRNLVNGLVGRSTVRVSKVGTSARLPSLSVVLPGGESHDDVTMMQHYGFASMPVAGGESLVIFPGGTRGVGVAIAEGDPSNIPTLSPGEVCLFANGGQKILLKIDGSIEIAPADGKRVRFASDVDVVGHLRSSGEVSAGGVDSPSGIVDALGVHLSTHNHPTAPSGPISPPTPGT